MRSKVPANTWFYASKVVGSKKSKKNAKVYLDNVKKCNDLANQFGYFMNNEWIFDNASAGLIMNKLQETDPSG